MHNSPAKLVIVAAVANHDAIGNNGQLPWGKFRRDMRIFQDLTMGHHCYVGYNTAKSLDYYLDGRVLLMKCRSSEMCDSSVCIHTIDNEKALKHVPDLMHAMDYMAFYEIDGPLMVIGGASVYDEAIKTAEERCIPTTIVVNRLFMDVEHDTDFPYVKLNAWRQVHRGAMVTDGFKADHDSPITTANTRLLVFQNF